MKIETELWNKIVLEFLVNDLTYTDICEKFDIDIETVDYVIANALRDDE